ncbi:MAG: hypothetical protein VW644_11060, partial [Alphaproteobacteria bacterium]
KPSGFSHSSWTCDRVQANPVIDALVRQNTDRNTGKRLARVHAVGFLSPFSTGRFATLMREVTRRNDGTFLALPVD